jgi:hypothetical protein
MLIANAMLVAALGRDWRLPTDNDDEVVVSSPPREATPGADDEHAASLESVSTNDETTTTRSGSGSGSGSGIMLRIIKIIIIIIIIIMIIIQVMSTLVPVN